MQKNHSSLLWFCKWAPADQGQKRACQK